MGQFFESIKAVKDNYKRYDSWEQNQADKRARKEYLAKTKDIPKDEIDLASERAKLVIRATEILDKHSEDNCEDMEQATNMAAVLPLAGFPLIGQFIVNASMKTKARSINQKIKQYKDMIRDPLAQKTENVADIKLNIKALEKNLDKIKVKYPFYGLLVNVATGLILASTFIMWGTAKQKEASRIGRYQARQKDLKDIKNFVVYDDEQQKEAEKIVKNIPDKKEKNGIVKIISNLNNIRKDKSSYKKWFQEKDPNLIDNLKQAKLTPEQLKKAKDDQELIVDIVKEINIKAEEYSENTENAFDTLSAISWIFATPIGFAINSLLKLGKVSGKIRAGVSFAVPILTSLYISMWGTISQKEASRVGRYVARKDLSSNPGRLLAYSDEDMAKAKDVKAEKQKKSVMEKVTGSFSFLKTYFKDLKEYKEYKKTGYQKQEKLHKAYDKINITDKQRKDAENLQKKVFLAFDEIDEMSQRYSEDVEAGTQIAKTAMSQTLNLLGSGAMLFATYAIAVGKFPMSKVVNTISNIGFKKDSSLRTSINNLYKELAKDKAKMHDFQLAIIDGELGDFLKSSKGKSLIPAYNRVKREIAKLFKGIDISKPDGFKNILNSHLKQGMISKWVRNLFLQSSTLYILNKTGLPLGKLSNYKTLIATGAVLIVPFLATLFAVPYMFNAWLTDMQKKAGKIGIMKAMENIDDPRVFAD